MTINKVKHQMIEGMGHDLSMTTAGQPRTSRGKARTAEILAAARALFIRGGYAELTMRQVADRVGISLSNVQHYFPTPEALLKAMLEDVMNSYAPAYMDIPSRFGSPRERLAASIRYLLADIKNPETEKLFVEIWSLATRDPVAREIFDRMYVSHRQKLAVLIAAVNPALSDDAVAKRAALVAMQIEGLMLLISDSKPKHPELDGIEDECLRAILMLVEAPEHR